MFHALTEEYITRVPEDRNMKSNFCSALFLIKRNETYAILKAVSLDQKEEASNSHNLIE